MPTVSATPLKHLAPGWFAMVMGLCGLALAWGRAAPLMGEGATAAALALGLVAALLALALAAAALLRAQRYPQAVAEDLSHPVRHTLVAAMPVSLILLATVATTLLGPSWPVRGVWMLGALWQLAVTVWVLGRWMEPGLIGPAASGKPSLWMGVTPALFIPVVGNVLTPLAGVALGLPEWSAAQFGVGLVFWPVVLALLLVRLAVQGLWPERFMPTVFISIAPPAVVGLAALQLGASLTLGWVAWGVAVFFGAWSARQFKRAVSQPFAITFWALSFPLAAFSALSLRLADGGPAWMAALGLVALALASLVIAWLVLATVKGLRDGSLLAPEPVAQIIPTST